MEVTAKTGLSRGSTVGLIAVVTFEGLLSLLIVATLAGGPEIEGGDRILDSDWRIIVYLGLATLAFLPTSIGLAVLALVRRRTRPARKWLILAFGLAGFLGWCVWIIIWFMASISATT